MAEVPVLSIGIIFRDDIRSIKRCLEALQPLRRAVPSELIMVDTGSTDGSRQIAEAYADRIYNFRWVNDFSAARNEVLKHCSGLWNLSVDTDEYLDGNIEEITNFLLNPRSQTCTCAMVVIRNYHTDEMVEGESEDFALIRIFKRGCFYVGKIHERIPTTEADLVVPLKNTVFHHDGYSIARTDSKKKRNLKLVQEELEKSPADLRTLSQCLDAAMTEQQAREYCRQAAQLIATGNFRENPYGAPLIRNAVMQAAVYKWSEQAQWMELAQQEYPESPFVQIDVSMYSGSYYCISQPERALQELLKCRKALKKFHSHGYNWSEFSSGTIKASQNSVCDSMNLTLVQVYCNLKKWHDAARELLRLAPETFHEPGAVGSWLGNLVEIWWRSDEKVVPALLRTWIALNRDTSNLAEGKKEVFLETGLKILDMHTEYMNLPANARSAAVLFGQLDSSCQLYVNGKIIEAQSREMAKRFADQIRDWKYVCARAVDRLICLGVVLPCEFYGVPQEYSDPRIRLLIKEWGEKTAERVTEMYRKLKRTSLPQIVWLYRLITASVSICGEEQMESLSAVYEDVSRMYLSTVYTPAMLKQENISLLPEDVRYGWYYLEACSMMKQGNPVEYVRLLRKGLQEAPGMKKMTLWLCSQVQEKIKQQEAYERELQALATQVKALLAAYPPEHPAVQTIKQSPAYRKIAHLL